VCVCVCYTCVTKPCVKHGIDKTYAEKFNRESKKRKQKFGDLHVHIRVILKCIMGKYNMKVD